MVDVPGRLRQNCPDFGWERRFYEIGQVRYENRISQNIKKSFDTVKGKLGTTKTVTETVPKFNAKLDGLYEPSSSSVGRDIK